MNKNSNKNDDTKKWVNSDNLKIYVFYFASYTVTWRRIYYLLFLYKEDNPEAPGVDTSSLQRLAHYLPLSQNSKTVYW